MSDAEELLMEFEERIQARIGKWALAIIGTIAVASFLAASQWFGLMGRVERIEEWKVDRQRINAEYDQFRQSLEGRLGRLEAGQESIISLIKDQRK